MKSIEAERTLFSSIGLFLAHSLSLCRSFFSTFLPLSLPMIEYFLIVFCFAIRRSSGLIDRSVYSVNYMCQPLFLLFVQRSTPSLLSLSRSLSVGIFICTT